MKGVSPISFDFSFEKDGRRMTLTCSPETKICKMITMRKLQKIL